jgi:hypothetical protein
MFVQRSKDERDRYRCVGSLRHRGLGFEACVTSELSEMVSEAAF